MSTKSKTHRSIALFQGALSLLLALLMAASCTPLASALAKEPDGQRDQGEQPRGKMEEQIDGLSIEEGQELYEPRKDYLLSEVDEQIAPIEVNEGPIDCVISFFSGKEPGKLKDSGHTLFAKYTLMEPAQSGPEGFDAFFSDPLWPERINGQYEVSLDLLDPGDSSEYYVALADATCINGSGQAMDAEFTELSNEGVTVDKAHFDAESGIAYVSKDLYRSTADEEIAFACQLQLLIASEIGSDAKTSIDVNVESKDCRVEALGHMAVSQSTCDVTTKLPICKKEDAWAIDLSHVRVKLNDSSSAVSLEEGRNVALDRESGLLEIFFAPITLVSVDVEILEPPLLDSVVQRAYGFTPTSSLAYVPEVIFDTIDVDSLSIGQTFWYQSHLNYWWDNLAAGDYGWQACVATGSYCYSWVNDPDNLYEYVAWYDNTSWANIGKSDLSNFNVSPSSSEAARNYFNYVIEFGNNTINGQNWHSEMWPVNCAWDSGQDLAHFGLQCCHSSRPVSQTPIEGQPGSIMFKVLDINLQDSRPYVVLAFVGPAVATQPGIGIYKFAIEANGNIELQKESDASNITSENRMYDLAGISYNVYADADCTALVDRILLDGAGHGISKDLKRGTYYVREDPYSIQGSGYALDHTIHPVAVSAGKTISLGLQDSPQSSAIDLIVEKNDYDLSQTRAQGDAALEGALFEIGYFDEYFEGDDIPQGLQPLRKWTLRSDAHGQVKLQSSYLVYGDELFSNANGDPCLPLGTVYAKEVAAPEGYMIPSDNIQVKRILAHTNEANIAGFLAYRFYDEVQRGSVEISKFDKESQIPKPLGAASIDGTLFDILNRSSSCVVVDAIAYEPGERVCTIEAASGVARTKDGLLPYGTYGIVESSAGRGYLHTDSKERMFTIGSQGAHVTLSNWNAASNQVKRGDLELVKVRHGDGKRLASIPFKIVSQTTGESHVIVTDSNGVAKTSSSWNSHASKSNGNDAAIRDDGSIDDDLLDPECGIWFGLTEDGWMTSPNDSLGALPYDTYTLEEIPCEANKGLEPLTISDIAISRDSVQVDLGTIENMPTSSPSIDTFLTTEGSDSHFAYAQKSCPMTDEISYFGLEAGRQYTLETTLHDKATGSQIQDSLGNAILMRTSFLPNKGYGSIFVDLSVDTTELSGRAIVCFEQLFDDAGSLIAEHCDLASEEQTIRIATPRIATHAIDLLDGDKVITADASAQIRDFVDYTNLVEGKTYQIRGSLMKRESSNASDEAVPIETATGNRIEAACEFIATSPSGTVSLDFDVDPSLVKHGNQIVVFEQLFDNGSVYAEHTDPDNLSQTLDVLAPSIQTYAKDGWDGNKEVELDGEVSIVDSVSFENLIEGAEYTMIGKLMRVNSDGSVEPMVGADQKPVASQVDFKASSSASSVDVPFDFESDVQGASAPVKMVAFEELHREGQLIASHEDINSESQTVFVQSPSPKGGPLPQTGSETPLKGIIAAMLASLAIASCALAISSRVGKGRLQRIFVRNHQRL